MPPAYMLFLSAVFQFFQPDILTARMASSSVALASGFLLFKFLEQWKISLKTRIFIIALLLSDFLFIKTTHSSRMESLCLFFALAGFTTSGKPTIGKSESMLRIVLTGLFLALSFLSHPFGAVYGIISLYPFYQKKILNAKSLLYLAVGFAIPLLLWINYIYPNYDLFRLQFGAQFSRKSELFTTFSQFTKIKIILSSFRFPIARFCVFLLLIAGLFFYRKKFRSEYNGLFQFSLIWLIFISIFLYLSSESWYVVYLMPPVVILTGLFFERKDLFSRLITFASIGLNAAILIWIILQNFLILRTPEKTNEFFALIDKELQNKNRIYIQSIPDPYFYLKKKHPEKIYLEFMPGELSLSPENFQETIKKQDAFLFYNEELINSYIKKYLEQNAEKFERKIIKVDTGNEKELKLETYLYLKK